MFFGFPFMCIKTIGQSNFKATFTIAGSVSIALISLINDAPDSSAARATFDFVVSIDIHTSEFFLIPSITGITLEISSSKDTGSENGLVDSPPISIMSAP